MATSKVESDPVTLSRFILEEQKKHPEASGDLTLLMNSIQVTLS